jgi:hypothetical protein
MSRIITKVKKCAREKCKESKKLGWNDVLEDIKSEMSKLTEFARIVERKIERGEPWPGTQSSDQSQEQQHNV